MKVSFVSLIALPALSLPLIAANTVPEPETVFYGRILERSGPADRLLTEGALVWKLQKADGTRLLLEAALSPLKDGEYSYSLRVPHQALSLGLTTDSASIPLSSQPTRQRHLDITVNGQAASILSPGESVFDAEQALRAMTVRLDLEVRIPAVDTDGDGMADWWEDAHGLDKQSAADASADPDGDGRSNLAEFLAGSEPDTDSRIPVLQTAEVIAYAGGASALLVETADSDSAPAQLVYTLTSVPDGGALILRNPDRPLQSGDTFTQQDVNSGRLIFQHGGDDDSTFTSFAISVKDENPAHPADSGSVQVMLYAPAENSQPQHALESLRLAAQAAVSSSNTVVADLAAQSGIHRLAAPSAGLTAAAYSGSYVPAYGEERPHILFGGARQDFLSGGRAPDQITGSGGADELTGSGGADRFHYTSVADGNDTITDFTPADGDAIDLTAVLQGTSRLLGDYVRITRSGSDALLGVDADGSASGYSDLVIRLRNSPLTGTDLRKLFEDGNLLTGQAVLPPQVTLLAAVTRANENGAPWGQFTLTRSGSSAEDLAVMLQITGSATNGTDYELIQPLVIIPAGSQSLAITVRPYADAVTELDEVVQLTVLSGPSYETALPSSAQVIIEDLKPQISIAALNPVASVADLSPAAFVVNRTGQTDRSVLVRLNITGNASNGTDYQRIDNYLSLAAFQTSGVIQIIPRSTATLSRGAESVVLTVNPDSTYRTGNPSRAAVTIVPETVDIDRWRQSSFPGNTQNTQSFALSDPGSTGIPNLLRYGFGLDAAHPLKTPALLPQAEMINGHLALRFHRRPAATDLEYRVEMSEDMTMWRDAGPEIEDLTATQMTADPTASLYRVTQPASQSAIRFLRVRVVRVQP